MSGRPPKTVNKNDLLLYFHIRISIYPYQKALDWTVDWNLDKLSRQLKLSEPSSASIVTASSLAKSLKSHTIFRMKVPNARQLKPIRTKQTEELDLM